MNDLDYILSCLLIPVAYVLIYIAGKYDVLSIVCNMLQAELEKHSDKSIANVVRCKDCKWFNTNGCAIEIIDASDEPKEDDFCSFGERKDGAKDEA